MRYISVIQDKPYMLWQQELQAYSFRKVGLLGDLLVVMLIEPGAAPSDYAHHLMKCCDLRIYENRQEDRSYLATNKPYGLQRLLQHEPWLSDRIFLLDSDVIFREPLDIAALEAEQAWCMSDTVSYIGHSYLSGVLSAEQIAEMAAIVGIDVATLKAEQPNSGGAQYYMRDVTTDFCRKVVEDSLTLHRFLQEQAKMGSKVQVWTAEMWAWLWNAMRVAPVKVVREMDFSWATFEIEAYERSKMLHMAGVVKKPEHEGMFYKGNYHQMAPWDDPDLLVGMSDRFCSWRYLELMLEYAKTSVARSRSGSPTAG